MSFPIDDNVTWATQDTGDIVKDALKKEQLIKSVEINLSQALTDQTVLEKLSLLRMI
jgi:hypothetical protein